MLPNSEACERNKGPILGVLRECLRRCTGVLEIGSGTGQHAVHFADHLPHLIWHPTERLQSLAMLALRIEEAAERVGNLAAPTVLDVRQKDWPVRQVDAIFTANTLHILCWAEVEALFAGVGNVLAEAGILCIYGPFRYGGRYTSPSNEVFDRMLKDRDPLSGLRDIERVSELANRSGLVLTADHDLPAFNRLLVLEREPSFGAAVIDRGPQ